MKFARASSLYIQPLQRDMPCHPPPSPSPALGDRPFPFDGYSLLIHEYGHVNATLHVCRGSPLCTLRPIFQFFTRVPSLSPPPPPQPGPDRGSFLSSRKRRGSLCPRPFAFPPTPPPPFQSFSHAYVHASVRRLAISLGGNAPSLTTLLLDFHASGNGITSGQTPFAASSFSFEKKKKKRKKSSLFFAVNAYIYIYLYPGASGNSIANVVFLVRNF